MNDTPNELPATPICDEEFTCTTELVATAARQLTVRLRAWRRTDGSYVAVATDLNRGAASVTNAADWLWAAVRERLGLTAGTLLYSFEHYPHRSRPEWDRVLPQQYDARRKRYLEVDWKHGSRQKVEELIGTSITEE